MKKITIYVLMLFCSCGRNHPKPTVAVVAPGDTIKIHLPVGILKDETAQNEAASKDITSNATIKKPKTNTTMDDLKLTKEFEWFDQERYDRRVDKSDILREYLPNGTYIQLMDTNAGEKYYEATPKDSYFQLLKVYYPSGRIRAKGWAYINYFQKGVWYGFDDGGNLIGENNYDTSFIFTFEDVLKFCQKNGIKVEKGDLRQVSGWTTKIRRNTIEDRCWWEIEYMKYGTPALLTTLYLDGRNGKVVATDAREWSGE